MTAAILEVLDTEDLGGGSQPRWVDVSVLQAGVGMAAEYRPGEGCVLFGFTWDAAYAMTKRYEGTFGHVSVNYPTGADAPLAICRLDDTHALIAWLTTSNEWATTVARWNGIGGSPVIDFLGRAAQFAGYANHIDLVPLSSTLAVMVYVEGTGTTGTLKARALTVNLSTGAVTLGTAITLDASVYLATGCAAAGLSATEVIAYCGNAYLVTVSGTTLTLADTEAVSAADGSESAFGIDALGATTAIAYWREATDGKGWARLVTLSGGALVASTSGALSALSAANAASYGDVTAMDGNYFVGIHKQEADRRPHFDLGNAISGVPAANDQTVQLQQDSDFMAIDRIDDLVVVGVWGNSGSLWAATVRRVMGGEGGWRVGMVGMV